MKGLRFVDIESPYRGETSEKVKRNILYAKACVHDSLSRGEFPFASHLFINQPGILDYDVEKEREMTTWFGKTLIENIPNVVTVVYQNLGISDGMREGINEANMQGRQIQYRVLGSDWEEKTLRRIKNYPYASAWDFNSL
jgi:hypothetical protein